MNSIDVRKRLTDALVLDLVGPTGALGDAHEVLPQNPSRWYLTGFLVPLDADDTQRAEPTSAEEMDGAGDPQGADDGAAPEPAAARQKYLPSSLGLSLLISAATRELRITVRWGDYAPRPAAEKGTAPDWVRTPHERPLTLALPEAGTMPPEADVEGSAGLKVAVSVRPVYSDGGEADLPRGTRSVSVFLINRRTPAPDVTRDTAFAFQAEIEVSADEPLVPRPNLRGLKSNDPDERIADLQYRDAFEYAVGHGTSAAAACDDEAVCRAVRSVWLPQAEVERVAPTPMEGVTLKMDDLARLADGADATIQLGALAAKYRVWLGNYEKKIPLLPKRRKETALDLLQRAKVAAKRIEQGITLLADPQCLEAFRIANRAMAMAARRRLGVMQGKDPESIVPEWRPFQLAFVLMNLPGIADPTHGDREVVDLLFFPTGGGKTEAYLGLAAFTLVLRRLRDPGIGSAGLSVLMRYTLRLLTLDQLSRAATLICALELERQQDVVKLGEWPFEIGLWVGKAATPNDMGFKGDNRSDTARAKTIAFKNNDRKPSPIPLEDCPWCGEKFRATSFNLKPNDDAPTDLRITCMNRQCTFTRNQPLPILSVDEPIYRRLPCFLIATVDKFASMPWTGEVGGFFGRVARYVDKQGFFGPCSPTVGRPLPQGRLAPPDLIIQDELHLISGPLGTMAGLYESAIDELCMRTIGDRRVGPKIVASTATVRRAEAQIRALFNRRTVDIFPPPGLDRRDSFFAETHRPTKSHARLYIGIAAQGRSPKGIMLRAYLALMAAAQKAYDECGGKKKSPNPADPYMTLLGYFNSLRELGGARRIVEDEVTSRLHLYERRKRVNEPHGLFGNRKIDYEPVELTSRVTTDKVSDAKRRLALSSAEKERVDVALATNMISVGLDITRLGLMVVFGQPKTSAEYIQATSRVGRDVKSRDDDRPGLVVTVLNVHKPRDRSHYERFTAYHESFYRSVEATSVTPFSPRALDRGLVGTVVALARQGHERMTAPLGAQQILQVRPELDFVVHSLAERAAEHADLTEAEAAELRERVRLRATSLLESWSKIAMDLSNVGGALQYQRETGGAQRLLYEFLNPELKTLTTLRRKFRANRSLRDVEPSVNLWMRTKDGIEIDVEDDA